MRVLTAEVTVWGTCDRCHIAGLPLSGEVAPHPLENTVTRLTDLTTLIEREYDLADPLDEGFRPAGRTLATTIIDHLGLTEPVAELFTYEDLLDRLEAVESRANNAYLKLAAVKAVIDKTPANPGWLWPNAIREALNPPSRR